MADQPIAGGNAGELQSERGSLLRQALRAVEAMQRKLEAAESRARQMREPIAIVGMGCRFPGDVSDAESFWRLLKDGREAITEVPADRWLVDDYYDPDPAKPGKMVSRFGGFLSDIDQFDAAFFGIAPREAAMMDPQQRILLEVTWQALESGAIAPKSLSGSQTGVYLGMTGGDYGQLQMQAGDAGLLDTHFASGNGHSIASGRLAYLLGLKGPSLTVDTACSSSLVAVHLACQALRAGECSMAIAGGVNVILAPETTVALSHAHMLSPDGRCKAFDARADGFARAEGCGVVVLKPLSQAEADGDGILAVIRGTALNQDGASSSLTAPNGTAQVELMRRALLDSGRSAADVGYVEAHGTGTALGDPIELRALGAVYGSVYGSGRKAGELLPVGSLKTNFGHMEAAAGIGGLIKLVLALEHGEIPAHARFETPTKHVPWDQLKLTVPRATMPWVAHVGADGKPVARVGAVSSFGFSGTNAHLVVEQAPVLERLVVDGEELIERSRLLPVSAKSESALRALALRYSTWQDGPDAEQWSWAEIAATAGVGRDHLRHRVAVVASGRNEAAASLRNLLAKAEFAAVSGAPSLCFLFTGQGSERSGMGLELLQRSAVFRSAVERLEAGLDGGLSASLAAIWANKAGELELASLVQPALYAYGWALSELWRSWGVEPRVVMGHSLGEYVAATVAGVMTPEEGIRLVAARGRLTEALGEPGGMVAVAASEETVRSLLGAASGLSLAAVNGPSSVVVSGTNAVIEGFEERLKRAGLRHKRLRTTHGFHSAALDGMLDAFEAEAAKVRFRIPEVRWISNLTGEPVGREQPVDARYWRRHLREPVRFQAGLVAAEAAGEGVFLEVGAEPQLMALAEVNGIPGDRLVASISKSGAGDWGKLLAAAGRLYTLGVDLDWKVLAFEGGVRTLRKVPLPGYPFERQRFWFTDVRRGAGQRSGIADAYRGDSGHPLLGSRLRTRSEAAIFHAQLTSGFPAHLGDHQMLGRRILPGSAYLEMALAAGRVVTGGGDWAAMDVEFLEPCVFTESRLLETVLHDAEDGRRRFEIASSRLQSDGAGGDDWTLHATGFLESSGLAEDESTGEDLKALQSRAEIAWERETFYGRMAAAGVEFGPAFQSLRRAWGGTQESLVELELLPAVLGESEQYGLHPVALDAVMQAIAALVEREDRSSPALLAAADSYRVLSGFGGDLTELRYARAVVRKRQGRAVTVDVYGLNGDGKRLLAVEGLTLVTARSEDTQEQYRGWLHEVVWERVDWSVLGGLVDADETGSGTGRRVLIVTSGSESQPTELAHSFASLARARGAAVAVVSDSSTSRESVIEEWIGSVEGENAEVFYLVGAEIAAVDPESSGREVLDWQERVLGGALIWTQDLLEQDRLAKCRLWLVSRGASGPEIAVPDGATLAAFARSVRGEYPGTQVMAVDLAVGEADAERLWQFGETATTLEAQYVLRGGDVWVPRLVPRSLETERASEDLSDLDFGGMQTRRLRFPGTGLLEDLKPVSEMRRAPLGTEMEIEIRAAAINFHEVLSALDPEHSVEVAPGGECAGVVSRVGPDVSDLQVGDEVVAIGFGLMSDYATLTRGRVWKKPSNIGLEDAATLLIPFLTARWSLQKVAGLRAGESVLIHSGAGGVGLAAIQEARLLGARVFATAGSEGKRRYLLSLGVEAVFDSRSAAFEQGVLAATGGRGVDVVLNSLAGEKIAAGLRSLVAGGRFIELGERTILTEHQVKALRSDVLYEVIYLREALGAATPEVCDVIASVLADVEAERLQPLPWERFALGEATEAFRFMAAGQHTGRVLLVPRTVTAKGKEEISARFPGFRRDGAYVVSGGFGGLGLLVVEWLAQQGAGCVMALGRSELTVATQARMDQLRARGTEVVSVRCDLSDDAALAEALGAIPEEFKLRGVFHCAAAWENAALPNQTLERYRSALAGKVAGAWNLHRQTRSAALDCFVLFSSVAGLMGSRGQSNYAAANAYLDALAHFRRDRLGLTALSVNWGVWSETGASVRHGMVEKSERSGAASISPAMGFGLLLRLLQEDCTQVMASRVDWKKWRLHWPAECAANADLLGALSPLKEIDAELHGGASRVLTAGQHAGAVNWREQLLAMQHAQRRPMLASRVEERVRTVLSLGPRQPIDGARPLQEYGLDSLLSIELRNALSSDLAVKLSATALFDYPTLVGLTDWLFEDVLKLQDPDQLRDMALDQSTSDGRQDVLAGVAALSDEDVERLFQQKMAGAR